MAKVARQNPDKIILALRFERRHLPFRTWYHKRMSGRGAAADNCCILLEDDAGGGTSELLLESDTTGFDCLQPEDC